MGIITGIFVVVKRFWSFFDDFGDILSKIGCFIDVFGLNVDKYVCKCCEVGIFIILMGVFVMWITCG